MTEPLAQRPMTPATLDYALRLVEMLREQDRPLPDIVIRRLNGLLEAMREAGIDAKYNHEAADRAGDVERWGRHHLFGMRVIVDPTVPHGVIEFRNAPRLPWKDPPIE